MPASTSLNYGFNQTNFYNICKRMFPDRKCFLSFYVWSPCPKVCVWIYENGNDTLMTKQSNVMGLLPCSFQNVHLEYVPKHKCEYCKKTWFLIGNMAKLLGNWPFIMEKNLLVFTGEASWPTWCYMPGRKGGILFATENKRRVLAIWYSMCIPVQCLVYSSYQWASWPLMCFSLAQPLGSGDRALPVLTASRSRENLRDLLWFTCVGWQ